VIAGDWDIVTKLDANRAIAQESALARLAVVPGANHPGPMECAEVYDRMIGEFALQVIPDAPSDRGPAAQPDLASVRRAPPPEIRPPLR
jgi:hypothetical protein